MKYKPFGNTGINISCLGFGAMRLPTIIKDGNEIVDEELSIEMFNRAYQKGINYFDSAYFYCGGLSEVVMGKALKPFRNNVYVSTKSPGHLVKKKGDYRRILEEQLTKLDMDYIDFYHFHGIGYENFYETDKNFGWIADAERAKSEGLIKHISFSFHDRPENMIKLVDTGLFESVLCQYNLIDRSNEEAIRYAKSKGLGVAVMGPVGGGRVAGLPREVLESVGLASNNNAELALKFVLSNPDIDCALSGMGSMQMVEENTAAAASDKKLSEEEVASINSLMEKNKKLSELYCTGCSYCMPCPKQVNIPKVFELMNYYKIYGLKNYARNGYREIGTNEWVPGKRADSCINCGVCEEKCPQKIKIRLQLKQSHEALRDGAE